MGLCKTCGPRAGPLLPQGYNFNNFGRGPLNKATYQISKAWAFWFQTRRFLKGFPCMGLCITCASGAGPFLCPGL